LQPITKQDVIKTNFFHGSTALVDLVFLVVGI